MSQSAQEHNHELPPLPTAGTPLATDPLALYAGHERWQIWETSKTPSVGLRAGFDPWASLVDLGGLESQHENGRFRLKALGTEEP
jgi:hypothetical protein